METVAGRYSGISLRSVIATKAYLRGQETISASDALAVNTFEAITDILWVEKDCPVEVLFTALEAILHASLDRNSISIETFSRWLRTICTMLLASLLDEAKRWFEASTTICRFVPDGDSRAAKISETYSQLLERCSSS
ncbi:hypothetical protein WOLCODRAFT_28985 [Wolfiporia cocos MD-104 SS10]|uniref:Uncharacterized protein n=1 Tax=Wolfiporia cocos (strain MD-104) TaxID=742152 RepID=A0A2H3JHM4_WOLCO|nr:hypothetical protein WOLCODRAFT_28985 [Wolfiporia cocos MD-104 SS10]